MSMLSITPDAVVGAGGNLENLGFALRSAAAAASRTTAIAAPAADEVSTAVTSLFGVHAQEFQAVSARAAAFHDQFVSLLNGGAAQYVNAELTNAQQTVANAVNAPIQGMLGNLSPAAAAAAITDPTNQSFRIPLGPFTISGNQTLTTTTDGFSGVIHAGVTFNGLRGPVPLLSASGSENFSETTGILSAHITGSGPRISGGGSATLNDTTGAFSGRFAGTGPFYSADGSVRGLFPVSGTGSPRITALSLHIDGIPLPAQSFTGYLNGLLQQSFASV